jgi:hypothetical protein
VFWVEPGRISLQASGHLHDPVLATRTAHATPITDMQDSARSGRQFGSRRAERAAAALDGFGDETGSNVNRCAGLLQ